MKVNLFFECFVSIYYRNIKKVKIKEKSKQNLSFVLNGFSFMIKWVSLERKYFIYFLKRIIDSYLVFIYLFRYLFLKGRRVGEGVVQGRGYRGGKRKRMEEELFGEIEKLRWGGKNEGRENKNFVL